ncbi:MAG: LpxL/LpxP family Kdo(2)-lipid IV(A) lauroyl/palmitoleoyl acyltransferase [Gammaproteobacteria bacterium]
MDNASEQSFTNFLAPKYWPIWLVLGFLRASVVLPYRLKLMLGKLVGRLVHMTARRRRIITNMNFGLLYPEGTDAERKEFVRKHFDSIGMGTFEIAMCWWASEKKLQPLVRIEGMENVESALQHGKGVILLSAHFTTLEIGGRLLGLFTNFDLMYRPNKHLMLDWIIAIHRKLHFDHVIPRDDIRALLRSLKKNRIVWYAPDQGYLGKNYVRVPFFGMPAPTNTATSRIAKASGAKVLPFMVKRLPGAEGYLLKIQPPLDDFPSGDNIADATRINAIIETDVRQNMGQYLWCHNRFKDWSYLELL